MPEAAARRAAERHGHRSESLAALWLRLKGYRILGRRVKTRAGEIDLIALPPFGPVCMIEVKARRVLLDAAAAVAPAQRARITRAACLYLAGKPGLAARGVRFDIVAVAGFPPRHFRDVWRADD